MNFADVSCETHKLKIKQVLLDKYVDDFLKSFKNSYGINFEPEQALLLQNREKEIDELQAKVKENFKLLKNIKCITAPGRLETIDLYTLKNLMLSFENSMVPFKRKIMKSDLKGLADAENALNVELTNIELKYIDSNSMSGSNEIKNKINKSITKFIYKDVNDFATFIKKTGGHDGGWEANDHFVFIRNYNSIKNRNKLITKLRFLLPDISEENINNHIDWYEKYLMLKSKQKEAIMQWRKEKQKSDHNSEDIEDGSEQIVDTKSIIKLNLEKDRQDVKEKIEKWKKKKQEKQKMQDEMHLLNLRKNLEKDKERKEEMQKEKKIKVERWRSCIRAQEILENLSKEILALKNQEQKIAVTNKLIRDYQNQDQKYIMRKLRNFNLQSDNQKLKTVKRKNVERQPDRIFKSTKQWNLRSQPELPKENHFLNSKFPMSLGNIPKLGVPAWRTTVK